MSTTAKRVLCVEDNSDDCELIKTYLGWEAIDVIFAGTCDEALTKAKSEHIDLYLIDERMPDCSEIELTHQIRDFDSTTPIIFHSAHGFAHVVESAMKAGAQKFLQKQGDDDDVVRTIKHFIGAKVTDIPRRKKGH
jgi:two-component system, NarL family, sensor histidine kinase BarA